MFKRKSKDVKRKPKEIKGKQKEPIEEALVAFNTMYKDVLSKVRSMEKIYPETKRNGFIGPINRSYFQSILFWQEGKKEAWFLMKMDVYEEFQLFEMLNNKQLKLKNIVDAIGKSLDKLKVYTDETVSLISSNGQMEK